MARSLFPKRLPILFLHGGGVSGWMWAPLIDRLDTSIDPIVPDLPGHGHNAHERYRDHKSTAAILAEIIHKGSPSGVHIVGFSLGAQLAILLASRYPTLVKSAVIVSAETLPAPMPRTTLALLKWSLPLAQREWFARAQAKQLGVPPELVADYVKDSKQIAGETLLNSVGENIRFTLPPEWQSFGGKVAIVVGERERGLVRRSAQLTHDSLSGSDLTVVPGSAHDIPFTNPDVLANIIHAVADLSR